MSDVASHPTLVSQSNSPEFEGIKTASSAACVLPVSIEQPRIRGD